MKTNLLVLFGGASPEYFVSCTSAASLIQAVDRAKYEVHVVGIRQDGRWYLTNAPVEAIYDGKTWLSHEGNQRAVLSPDYEDHGLLVLDGDNVRRIRIDVAFPIIHGNTGEDGKLQGLLEIAGIPYVGSGVCASACSMDKTVSMTFADLCGLKHPVFFACERDEYLLQPQQTAEKIAAYFTEQLADPFPLFVKPASTGSSVGISKVSDMAGLKAALDIAAAYPGRLIVEQNIDGREMKIAVLGNDDLELGDVCEVVVESGIFNDYQLKYNQGGSHKHIPADIPDSVRDELLDSAVRIYRKFGCRGFARVDFFVQADNTVVFNEINTVPGFTTKSIYSLMFTHRGISYEDLVERLIQTAFA